MIAPGTYKARVIQHGWDIHRKRDRQTGAETGEEFPKCCLTFQLERNQPHAGETIDTQLFFVSEANAEISKQTLKDCGWDGDEGTAEDLNGIGTKVVELVIQTREYKNRNGETRQAADVKFINNPDRPRGGARPLSEEGKAVVAGMLGQFFKTKPKPAPVANDDCPI